MLDFFHNLLGTVARSTSLGEFRHLTTPLSLDSHQAMALEATFTMEEARAAISAMWCDSASGPGGFGPKIFQANWLLI